MVLVGIGRTAVGDDASALDRYEQSQVHMATIVKVVVYAPTPAAATAGCDAAFARCKELNEILSDYLDESELNRFCAGGFGRRFKLSPELFFVLERAQYWNHESAGAFDVTLGPVIRYWRLARKTKHLPTPEKLAELKKLTGDDKLVLDPSDRTGQLKISGMKLDVGGLGKGYVGDEMIKALAKHGLSRAIVILGGDVVCGDAPPNAKGWTVAIASLTKSKEATAARTGSLILANAAASTAGDANQFVEIKGKRYSHIIDPATGMAQIGRRQVTIVARTGIDADAMDTAACVLGVEKGMKFANDHQAGALFVTVDDAGHTSETVNKHWADLPRAE